jgi:hypothetical protein
MFFSLISKWPWNMIHPMPCKNPCRLSIHLAFTYSVGSFDRSVKRNWTGSTFSTNESAWSVLVTGSQSRVLCEVALRMSLPLWCHMCIILGLVTQPLLSNVRGEPVFSVMVAGWFCEKSGWIGKVEDVKPALLKKQRISTGNHFEEEDFYLDELWNRKISSSLVHLGLEIIWL